MSSTDDTEATSIARRFAAVLDAAEAWDPPRKPTVIVVPHPDDEILMCGGLIRVQTGRDIDVTVVAVTDGEAAYPAVDAQNLARRRREEQRAALDLVGGGSVMIERLSVADGAVADAHGRIVEAVAERVSGDSLLVAPWVKDWHPDHEAVGRAVQQVARDVGCEAMFALFWAWHHRTPADVLGVPLVALALDDETVEVRRRALDEHVTQRTDALDMAILPDHLLEPMTWTEEFYIDGSAAIPRSVGRRRPGTDSRPLAEEE